MNMKTPPPLSSLDGLPLILNMRDFCAIYRKSPASVYRDLKNGTCRPHPWERNPYQWLKSDVEKDLSRRRDEQRIRNDHGFERMRPAKAKIAR